MPFNFIAESMPSKVVVLLLDLGKLNVLSVFLIKLFILTSSWVYMQFWEKIQRDLMYPILFPVSSSDNILQNYSLFSQPECWLSFMFKKRFMRLSTWPKHSTILYSLLFLIKDNSAYLYIIFKVSHLKYMSFVLLLCGHKDSYYEDVHFWIGGS